MKGQHLAKLATTAPATALCSSTLQRTSNQAPKRKQHSDSSTLSAAPCSAPATRLQSANSTLTAAPCSSTLQRHPCSCTPAAAPATQLQNAHSSDSSTLQGHPAAAPCNGTSSPAPKRKHATLPIVEVITPIASLSGAKKLTRGINQLWNCRSAMEKASWRAGKTAIMYDLVQISNHKI